MICRCVGSSCSIPTLTLITNRTTARQMHTDEALASPDWLHRYIVASSKLPVVPGSMIPATRHSTVPCALDRGAYTSRVLVVAPRDDGLSFRGFAVRQKFVLSRQHHQHPRRVRSPEL